MSLHVQRFTLRCGVSDELTVFFCASYGIVVSNSG